MEILSIIGSATLEKRSEEYGDVDVKKGPWTDQEDALLINAVHLYGERRWNSIAHYSGLKRTGKSCRLRWLNYVRPDVRRGNITLEEQLVILELHSRWGNRWSKIAKYLPGRTDNEIKNYWRTRVQKQAKQLNYDINSEEFNDAIRNVFMPQMIDRIRTSSFSCINNNLLDRTIFDSPNGLMNLTTDTNRGVIEPSQSEPPYLDHHECYNNNPLKYIECGDYSEAQSAQLGHLSSNNISELNRGSIVSGEVTTLDSNDNLGLDIDDAWFDFNGGDTSRQESFGDEEINAWLLRQLSDEDLPKEFACINYIN